MKELGKLVPVLSPTQIHATVSCLERSGAITIDIDGHIVWLRQNRDRLTLGEVAKISPDVLDLVDKK